MEPALLDAELHRRGQRRIAAFERTAELLASGVLRGPVAEGTLRRLGENYRFRSARWSHRRPRPSRTSQFLTMAAGVLFACVPGVIAFLLGSKLVALYAGGGLVLSSPLFVAVAYRSRYLGESTGVPAMDQAIDRFSNRRCVDCNHDLRGVASAFPADQMEGTNIGPRACPKCGTPWPLVPPA